MTVKDARYMTEQVRRAELAQFEHDHAEDVDRVEAEVAKAAQQGKDNVTVSFENTEDGKAIVRGLAAVFTGRGFYAVRSCDHWHDLYMHWREEAAE